MEKLTFHFLVLDEFEKQMFVNFFQKFFLENFNWTRKHPLTTSAIVQHFEEKSFRIWTLNFNKPPYLSVVNSSTIRLGHMLCVLLFLSTYNCNLVVCVLFAVNVL